DAPVPVLYWSTGPVNTGHQEYWSPVYWSTSNTGFLLSKITIS
ncbi:unnamed protein product, partial [Rotaria magnacalcarata]